MDQLSCIRYFLAVVDAGGFSAAALRMQTSPSAPIRAVAALERAFSTQLFRRTTRRVVLTAEGAIYAARCRVVIHDLQEAERQLREASSELIGVIRVTAPVMLGSMHVAPLIAHFLREHPKLTVDLQLNDSVVDLVGEAFDLGVRDSTMIATRLMTVEHVVCASAAYWAERGTPRRPLDLQKHLSVHYDAYTPHAEWTFVVNKKEISVQPSAVLSTNHLGAVRQACLEGLGCGLFLSYQVERDLRSGRLVRALARYAKPAIPVSVVAPPGRLVSLRVATLRQWLVKRLRHRLKEES
jgi:DNA-binding transcriptional LysR family regulator